MREGDLVAMVDERQGFLYLGRVCGPYSYSPAGTPLCNLRAVMWTSVFPISRASRACREHWRARTGLFPMGKILELMSVLEGDSLIRLDNDQAG
jgi:predicted Mrr-cat superfamily restriction endonuclease